MADCGKHGTGIVLDPTHLFRAATGRRTKLLTYAFAVTFLACTAYIAFFPSATPGAVWLGSLPSHFSSLMSTLFPGGGFEPKGSVLEDARAEGGDGYPSDHRNQTAGGAESWKGGVLWGEKAGGGAGYPPDTRNGSVGEKKGGALAVGKDRGAVGHTESKQNESDGNVGSREKVGKKDGYPPVKENRTEEGVGEQKGGVLAGEKDRGAVGYPQILQSQTGGDAGSLKDGVLGGNLTVTGAGSRGNGATMSGNGTVVGMSQNVGSAEKVFNGGSVGVEKAVGKEWSMEGLKGCDLYTGRWVRDENYPLYKEGSCPYIDEPFDCFLNGRSNREYQKLRWQPDGCSIPRLNATDMLERLRGKRLVFVGDSLNRNMWESLVCVLRNSIGDKRNVFEASGRHKFRTEGSYSFIFKDYGCSIEFFRSPFLVQEWEMPDTNGGRKETLRLDIIERSSSRYKDADVIVFNTGHWWTHDKTSRGKDYYQEGNRVYSELNVVEAFHKALNTWAKWVDVNVDPKKTMVFFRGYSSSHFSGGQWNSGGQCDHETKPIENDKQLQAYPPKMHILESVLTGMKTHVSYLNITRMTDYRKEAHPSIYSKPNMTEEERMSPDHYQDCSHWCLPGVPDSWNELLYTELIIRQHQLQ